MLLVRRLVFRAVDCVRLVDDKVHWWAYSEQSDGLLYSVKAGNFFVSWTTVMILPHGIRCIGWAGLISLITYILLFICLWLSLKGSVYYSNCAVADGKPLRFVSISAKNTEVCYTKY
jgi:hypothetical protein